MAQPGKVQPAPVMSQLFVPTKNKSTWKPRPYSCVWLLTMSERRTILMEPGVAMRRVPITLTSGTTKSLGKVNADKGKLNLNGLVHMPTKTLRLYRKNTGW